MSPCKRDILSFHRKGSHHHKDGYRGSLDPGLRIYSFKDFVKYARTYILEVETVLEGLTHVSPSNAEAWFAI